MYLHRNRVVNAHHSQHGCCMSAADIDVLLNVFLHRINESYLIWWKQWDLIQLPRLNVSPLLTGLLKGVNKAFRHDRCSINQLRWSANIHAVLKLFLHVSVDSTGLLWRTAEDRKKMHSFQIGIRSADQYFTNWSKFFVKHLAEIPTGPEATFYFRLFSQHLWKIKDFLSEK